MCVVRIAELALTISECVGRKSIDSIKYQRVCPQSAAMTDLEVYACFKLIRGSRQSMPMGVPLRPWNFGNLRLVDANDSLPKMDLVSRREKGGPVRLDVVVGPIVVEQWKITPGSTTGDATALSLLARSIFFYLRFGEIYADLVHRADVDVVPTERPVLPDDAAHRFVWSAGSDGTSVQVVANDAWRSALLERDAKSTTATPSNESFTPSSITMPRATPPLAPQVNVAGSFGTTPRVGQASALGAFVLPSANTTVQSPAMTFTKPTLAPDEIPPLVPVAPATQGTTMASPTSGGPGGRRGLPFGIGTSTFDLEEGTLSPASTGMTPGHSTSTDAGNGLFPDDVGRTDITGFLSVVSDFGPAPQGLPAYVSVVAASRAVLDA
jgi:hypothetical protein